MTRSWHCIGVTSCVLRAGSGASWCMRWPPWWSRGGTTCRSAAARAAAGTAASPRPRCWGCPCWSARWSPPSPSRPCCWLEARGWGWWMLMMSLWSWSDLLRCGRLSVNWCPTPALLAIYTPAPPPPSPALARWRSDTVSPTWSNYVIAWTNKTLSNNSLSWLFHSDDSLDNVVVVDFMQSRFPPLRRGGGRPDWSLPR